MKKNTPTESTPETPALPGAWPAFHVERRAFSKLKRDPRNARTHSPDQVRQIAASMREWGWTYPILVDEEDLILAGHGRLAGAELNRAELPDDMRWAEAVAPVIVARGWSEAQKRAYALADNQIALNASWAEDTLRFELGELHGLGFDIGLAGFELAALDPPVLGRDGPNLGSLAEAFGVPPFSVLNARDGWWQDRKRGWIALGIQSELGRGENLIGRSPQDLFAHATGIHYGKAREIVTQAMAEQGDGFDLVALIRKHGGRVPDAIPGGAGANSVYRDKANLGQASAIHSGKLGDRSGNDGGLVSAVADRARARAGDMARSGAVVRVGQGGGSAGTQLLEERARQKAARAAAAGLGGEV